MKKNISFGGNMIKNKAFLLLLTLVVAAVALLSCGGDSGNAQNGTYTVSFFDDNDNLIDSVSVEAGETVSTPQSPQKKNYIFVGWSEERQYGALYDFSEKVNRNIRLYARFRLDGTSITNEISKNVMKSVVKVRTRSYSDVLFGWIETESSGWSTGSGFCFDQGSGYYYILTNCHVAAKTQGYDKVEYEIIDYKGNVYTGYLYNDAIDPAYDLAVVYFKSSNTEVTPLKIIDKNPAKGDDVIALGAPDSQSNSITFGKVNEYRQITLDNCETYRSDVNFPVIRHSAYIAPGSSGGPLLNSELNVVGVNYAVSTDNTIGSSIPAEKIHEFLQKYVYK